MDPASDYGFSFSSPIPTSAPARSEYLSDMSPARSLLDPIRGGYGIYGYEDDVLSLPDGQPRQKSAPLLSASESAEFVRAPSFGGSDFAAAMEGGRAHSVQPTPTPTMALTQSSLHASSLPRLGHARARSLNPTVTSVESLQAEDKLLLKLKTEETLSWKDIASRFRQDLGQTYQIPALQMRYKRLKERIRVWEPSDIEALKKAREYWESKKYDIIASKVGAASAKARSSTGLTWKQQMAEYGAQEKHSAEACKRKLAELSSEPESPPRKLAAPSYSSFTSSRRSGSPASARSSAPGVNMRPPPLPSNSQPPGSLPLEAFGSQPAWQPWS